MSISKKSFITVLVLNGLIRRKLNLTKTLANIIGKTGQMLTRIVQRWGSLRDELKRAVLRVVG